MGIYMTLAGDYLKQYQSCLVSHDILDLTQKNHLKGELKGEIYITIQR